MNQFTVFFVCCAALVALSVAGKVKEEEETPKSYTFDYAVSDPHTGDKKEQKEVKEGKVVKGSYSFKEADGTLRVVEYVADPYKGFNAVVKRIGKAYHPTYYKTYGGGKGGESSADGESKGEGAYSVVGTTNFGYNKN